MMSSEATPLLNPPLVKHGEVILNSFKRYDDQKITDFHRSPAYAVLMAVAPTLRPTPKYKLVERVLAATNHDYTQAADSLLSLLADTDLVFMTQYPVPTPDDPTFSITPEKILQKSRDTLCREIGQKINNLPNRAKNKDANSFDADLFLKNLPFGSEAANNLTQVVDNILAVLTQLPTTVDPHQASPVVLQAFKDSYKYWRLGSRFHLILGSKTKIPQMFLGFLEHISPGLDGLEKAAIARELITFLYNPPKTDKDAIELVTETACHLDKAATQAAVYPYLNLTKYYLTNLVNEYCVASPSMRTDTMKVVNSSVFYYGHEYVIDELKEREGPLFADEIQFGFLSIRDGNGKPVCLIDASPFARPIKPKEGEPIGQDFIPPERFFYQFYARDVPATDEEVLDYLANYHRFYAPDGTFCQLTKLGEEINFNTLLLEPKFWLYHGIKKEHLTYKMISDLVAKNDMRVLNLFSTVSESPQNFDTMYRYADSLDHSLLLKSLAENKDKLIKWFVRKPAADAAQINKVLESLAQPITPQKIASLPEEFAAWAIALEGFSGDVSETILPPAERDIHYATKTLTDLNNAILHRTRRMTLALAKFMETNPDWKVRTHEMQFYHDGLQAQKALLDLLSLQGFEGLGKAVNLPPFFFQEYRNAHWDTPEAQTVLDSLLETWEVVYTLKSSGKSLTQHYKEINDFWQAENAKIASTGEQTGNTAVEVARDEVMMRFLQTEMEAGRFPKDIKIIDFGLWNGLRILKPLLANAKRLGFNPEKVFGVDINRAPDLLEGVDLYVMPFIEAARHPDLIGQADIGKSDWSASNEVPMVPVHMVNAAAYNLCLKMGAYFKLDTAFPEGQGSYDEVMRELKKNFPDLPEGSLLFGYQGSDVEPKVFYLYYYEILFKLMEDAGFEITNIKLQDIKDGKYDAIIKGEVGEDMDYTDLWKTPIWRSRGKPRISIIAKKVREATDTPNIVLQQLYLGLFSGTAFTLPQVVENKSEYAA